MQSGLKPEQEEKEILNNIQQKIQNSPETLKREGADRQGADRERADREGADREKMRPGFGMRLRRAMGKVESIYTLIGLLLMCIVLSFMHPAFLSMRNFSNIFLQASINGILAIGITFVIISSGIDLSVGSILALSGIVTGNALSGGMPLAAAVIFGMLTGGACGFFNGLIITRFNMPPFIVTLGTMSIARGLALLSTNGGQIYGFDAKFLFIGQGKIAGLPMPVVILILLALLSSFILKYTRFGRYCYALGGNMETAKLSGISPTLYLTLIYTLSGVTAGIAGIVLASRLSSAQPIAGISYELYAIAAAVIGGTSLAGGTGTVFGTIIGALIISVIRNGMNLLNVNSFLQQVVIGSVIILAVMIDSFRKRNRS
jgi:ribose/xylose/arabinose/galactoside ABC-type transport system permease subunit